MNLEKISVGGNLYDICDAKARTMISDEYNPATQYSAGDYCIWENTLKKANKSTTGTYDPTAWDDSNLGEAVNELNQNMVITGWYQPGANSISEAVSYAHNLLQDHQSINAIVRYSVSGSDNSLHIIGSKHNQARGRYLAMNRTTDIVYSFRVTDSGMEEVAIPQFITLSGSKSFNPLSASGQYTIVTAEELITIPSGYTIVSALYTVGGAGYHLAQALPRGVNIGVKVTEDIEVGITGVFLLMRN